MAARLFTLLFAVAAAVDLPARTNLLDAYGTMHVPAVTAAPEFKFEVLHKRVASSLCGYVNGIQSFSYACDSDEYCGFNSAYSAFGCCTATVGESSLAGCQFFTSCYDAPAYSASCDSACQNNTLVGWCTTSSLPYCRRYTIDGFQGYDCDSSSGITLTLEDSATGGGAAPGTVPNGNSIAASTQRLTDTASAVSVTSSRPASTAPRSTSMPSSSETSTTSTHQTSGSTSARTVSAPAATTSNFAAAPLSQHTATGSLWALLTTFMAFWMR